MTINNHESMDPSTLINPEQHNDMNKKIQKAIIFRLDQKISNSLIEAEKCFICNTFII